MNFIFQYKKYFSKKKRYWILLSIFLVSISLHAQSNKETIDSLENLLNTTNLDDNKLFSIYQKFTDIYEDTDAKKSLEYALIGIRLAMEKNNSYQIAKFYYNAGYAFYVLNQADSALYCFNKSFDWLKQAEKKRTEDVNKKDYLQFFLHESIGIINTNFGKYDIALEHFFEALPLSEKINAHNETAAIYNEIADVYYRMSNFEQAKVFYLKGEQLCRELNDSINLANNYTGLCGIYIKKKDYSKAQEYGEKSERILATLPNIPAYQLMSANQQLASVWLRIPDYDKAMEYAKKAVEYARQTGVSSYLASALYSLSNCYLKQKKYRESEETAFQALATDTTDVYINSVLYENIAQANIWMGNSVKGIEYFEKNTNAIRAYSNKNFQSSLSEMQVKYETEKKELKITALEKERGLIIWLSIAGGALLLLTLATFFLLWRWTVQKRRTAEKQRLLAEQQVKQLEQEKQLVATQAVLDGETRERARLARDLHDGLGSMLTGAKLSLLEMKKAAVLESGDVERFDKAVGLLDDSVREMRRVAHHLMPDSLSRFGLKPAVSDFCSNFPIIRFAYYGDESRLDPKLEVMIYRSIHELVNNALKHSGAGNILVQIIRESDRIAFTVQDDGCGFDPAKAAKGMGLQNIRTRVASYNGVFDIDSKRGEGTEVNVELRIEN